MLHAPYFYPTICTVAGYVPVYSVHVILHISIDIGFVITCTCSMSCCMCVCACEYVIFIMFVIGFFTSNSFSCCVLFIILYGIIHLLISKSSCCRYLLQTGRKDNQSFGKRNSCLAIVCFVHCFLIWICIYSKT